MLLTNGATEKQVEYVEKLAQGLWGSKWEDELFNWIQNESKNQKYNVSHLTKSQCSTLIEDLKNCDAEDYKAEETNALKAAPCPTKKEYYKRFVKAEWEALLVDYATYDEKWTAEELVDEFKTCDSWKVFSDKEVKEFAVKAVITMYGD